MSESFDSRTVATVSCCTVPSSSVRLLGRPQLDAVLGVSVQRLDHALERRDPLVGDHALVEHAELASVGQSERAGAQRDRRLAEVDRRALRIEELAGVTDPRARRHSGDVRHGQQLRRRTVQPGAGRADPDGDREGSVGDTREQRLHLAVTDDRAPAVHLEDQRLRAVGCRLVDGVLDRVDDDVVEQAADLQHVDRSVLAVVSRAGVSRR